jgi:2-keto-4-pentenoate hydratase
MAVRLSPALDAALRSQLDAWRRTLADGAGQVGWKVAASIPGIADDDGADGLVFGYLTSATVLSAGGRLTAGPTVGLAAEVELAILVSRDVTATGGKGWYEAVGGLAVALEIVEVDHNASMHAAVTSNVFHRAVAFGPLRGDDASDSLTAQLKIDGQVVATQRVQVDPAQTVLTMAQLLAAVDQELQAGDLIIGGSLIHVPIEPNHEVTASLEGLGEIALRIDP